MIVTIYETRTMPLFYSIVRHGGGKIATVSKVDMDRHLANWEEATPPNGFHWYPEMECYVRGCLVGFYDRVEPVIFEDNRAVRRELCWPWVQEVHHA